MKIFERRRKAAEIQIESRLNLLRHWALNGIPWQIAENGTPLRDKEGELTLDFTPKNVVEFAGWTAAKHSPGNRNSIVTCRVNETDMTVRLSDLVPLSRTTLSQPYRAEDKAAIDIQLEVIAGKAIQQLETSRKSSVIDTLKAERKFLKKVVAAQESEVRAARIEAHQARVEIEGIRRTAANNEAELKRVNSELEKKIASLVRHCAKIAPLKLQGDKNV